MDFFNQSNNNLQNNLERERPPRIDRAQIREQLHRVDMLRDYLIEILNSLNNNDDNFETLPSPSPSSPSLRSGKFSDSELLQRTRPVAAPTMQTAPYSRLLAANNGIHNESSAHYYSPPPSLNLLNNLFDDDNDLTIQYSPSHDNSLQHRFANSQSPIDQYYSHKPNLINSHNSLAYDNGLGSSGLQHREISSPLLFPFEDRDNIAPRHQYQRLSPFTSMDEVRGNVVMAAKNQHGSRFLQEKLRQGHPENIDMIFSETTRSLCVLMVHQFGHHVVQKLIDVVNDNKIEEILPLLTRDVIRLRQICVDDHGTKVLQKLVGRLSSPEQQYLLASALSRIALVLTKSTNGNAVIYQCLKNFSPAHKKFLLRIIAENCLDIAQDKCGCCILQRCFDEADNEIFNILAAVIIQNAETLSEHCYGNYVVQYVINMKKLGVNRNIVAKFEGKFVTLSMNKHGSNVVEKLVKDSGLEEVVDLVIIEILNSGSPLQVSQDLYGNYVVQSAIKIIREGDLFDKFVKHIKDNERYLQNHMYGKRVLQAINVRRDG